MMLPPNLITGKTSRLPGDYKKQPSARGRVVRREQGKMNRAEQKHADGLDLRIKSGEIAEWWFDRVTLTLAEKPEDTPLKGTRYTPDFMVLMADGSIEFHEVKGFKEDDAVVKFKVAAEQYNCFKWVWVEA